MPLTIERLIVVSFLLVAVGIVIAAAAATALNATNVPSTGPDGSFWDSDIFHLPPEVPFPGKGWLSRIADETTAFAFQGKTYTSAYEALVGHSPLDAPCRNMNAWLNSIVISPSTAAKVIVALNNLEMAHYALCYLRNFVGAMIVYYGTAGIFHFFCYIHPMSQEIFAKRPRPQSAVMWDQIKMAQASLFLYVLCVPVLDEFLIESGYTKVYYTINEIGGGWWYVFYTVLYFGLVEIGIYWMHRTLHTNKWMYKHIHVYHHKYNSPQTLTPWASIAFHPLDGILQASPYMMVLFLVPIHYATHYGLLFFTCIWATYIHDAMDWNIWPVMGTKYHTIHHTHYIYNYGQVFVFCDRLWGTFREPTGPTGVISTTNGVSQPRARPVTSRVGNKNKRF